MTLKRVLAPILFVILAFAAAPALAQQGPAAAPTGAPAATGIMAPPTAAPTTNVDIGGLAQLGSGTSGGFSIVDSFLRADVVVKTVMVLLLLASLWSWAIIINKWIVLGRLKRKAARFEKTFWSGQSLDELYQQFAAHNDHPLAAIFVAALREWRRAFEGGVPKEIHMLGVKDRIEKAMSVTIMRETDGIERQLGFLATVGSVAPFIGLFGTVWGIMNSFSAIAARHDTTLAVVAPGIAEALFATALGLFAAVPAVIFYNRFINEIARYANRLDAFSDEFSAILSRQLEEKMR
ncbi:MAG TPA: protein TolQ [Rhizomicrobium sp.]|nr:protein TolQ [Rhizomicrobium sp.]